MNIEAHKATDADEPSVTITIAEPVPDIWQPGRDTQLNLDAYAELYDTDAQRIADALSRALPGGTLDRVIIKLLTAKASHCRGCKCSQIRVAWPRVTEADE